MAVDEWDIFVPESFNLFAPCCSAAVGTGNLSNVILKIRIALSKGRCTTAWVISAAVGYGGIGSTVMDASGAVLGAV